MINEPELDFCKADRIKSKIVVSIVFVFINLLINCFAPITHKKRRYEIFL